MERQNFFVRKFFFRREIKKKSKLKIFLLSFLFLLLIFTIPFWQIFFSEFRFLLPYSPGFLRNFSGLIIFQNNAELRPGGGFLTAFAVVEIKNGKLDLQIFDSYAVTDPPAKINPPEAIEKFFSLNPKFSGWTFRDANFSENFPNSAEKVIEFLKFDERFAEKNFDAVVAVNFSTIENFLQKFGATENFSAENIFEALQIATKNITLNSEQDFKNRKNILKNLATEIFGKIHFWNMGKIINFSEQELSQKNIQIFFSKIKLQQKILEKNWGGNLPNNNFFAVILANLGAKKSDRFIRRQIFSDINVDPKGIVSEKFKIELFNRTQKGILSDQGNYFLKIWRPKGTKISGKNSTNFKNYSDFRGEVFESYFQISPGEEKIITVDFVLPRKWKIGENYNYNWISQSGAPSDFFATFSAPGNQKIKISGCQNIKNHENSAFCQQNFSENFSISAKLEADSLPPILEFVDWKNDQEILFHFSEPLKDFAEDQEKIEKSFVFSCGQKKFIPQKMWHNPEELRQILVIFDQNIRPKITTEFCQFKILGIDIFENSAEINGNLRVFD